MLSYILAVLLKPVLAAAPRPVLQPGKPPCDVLKHHAYVSGLARFSCRCFTHMHILSKLVSIEEGRDEKKNMSDSMRTRVVECPTSPQLPVFHLGHRPPGQRLCLLGLGDRQFSSGTVLPVSVTQLTLRDLKPLPQAAEHCKMSKERRG